MRVADLEHRQEIPQCDAARALVSIARQLALANAHASACPVDGCGVR